MAQGKQGKQGKWPKNSLSGKTQVILKVKDIAIVASWIGLPSQFSVCYTHKLCKLANGKICGQTGKTQGI